MEKSRLVNGVIGASLSLAAILLSIAAFEIFLRYSYASPYQWDLRLMFFSEGEVFRNKDWGGFVYAPNARIHSRTYYITEPSIPTLFREYEYDIATNSHGLVQRNDIDGSKPAILFLGDSYTEGHGASPWFYDLESVWAKNSRYQLINGGIQGTGIEAWERLYRDLARTTEIEKLVVIFISDDWTRLVWQYPAQFLECLRAASQCNGFNTFLGLPKDPAEAEVQVRRIAKVRLDFLARRKRHQNFFRSSQIHQQLLKPAYELWQPPARPQFERNKSAALRMTADLGASNVLFIHVPQKDELQSGPNPLGRQAVDFLRGNGLTVVDGFERCRLSIADFHPHDGHPNATGYGKLERCVRDSVEGAFDLPRTTAAPSH